MLPTHRQQVSFVIPGVHGISLTELLKSQGLQNPRRHFSTTYLSGPGVRVAIEVTGEPSTNVRVAYNDFHDAAVLCYRIGMHKLNYCSDNGMPIDSRLFYALQQWKSASSAQRNSA